MAGSLQLTRCAGVVDGAAKTPGSDEIREPRRRIGRSLYSSRSEHLVAVADAPARRGKQGATRCFRPIAGSPWFSRGAPAADDEEARVEASPPGECAAVARAAPHVALAAMRAITHVVGKPMRSSRRHAGPRQLAQPGRDLPLDHPAQTPRAQRLPRHRHPRAHAQRVRAPLQRDRPAVRLELHPRRPRRAARPPRRRPDLSDPDGRLTATELAAGTT
jgi:hypothetical protein